MAHIHSVYDSDTHFSANAVTRALKNESSSKTTLIQGDHNCERFTFQIPRMIEGHDMSLCNEVEVHYINIDAKTKGEIRGLYEVDDMQISPNGDDFVICSWLIDRHATQLVGQLSFLLRFKCVTDGIIDYAWHTAPYTGIYVSSGINADETFEDDYCNVIERWKESVLSDLTAEMRVAVDEMKDEVAAWEEAATINVRAEMTEFGNGWNATLDVERVRIDELAAMRTTGGTTTATCTGTLKLNSGGEDVSVECTFASNGAVAYVLARLGEGIRLNPLEYAYTEYFIPPQFVPMEDTALDITVGTIFPIRVRIEATTDENGYARMIVENTNTDNYVAPATYVSAHALYNLAALVVPELTDARVGLDNQGKPKTYDSVGHSIRAAQQMAVNAADLANGFDEDIAELYKRIAELQNGGGAVARISYVDLPASGWQGEQSPYSQVVAVEGATENSQVDLTPNVEQLSIFHNKDLAFVTENEDGVVTVYAIGQKPQNDYTIQVTITEVVQ